METVLVLNAGYEPHDRVTVKHAIRMIVRQVAVIEEAIEDKMFGPFPVPKVLRLVRYIRIPRKGKGPRYSKRRLMERDRHSCAYCGKFANTVDHVRPRSHGGISEWTNVVASCLKCNHKKRNRMPKDAGMELLFEPFEPTWYDFA
jgi:hypothetical protein